MAAAFATVGPACVRARQDSAAATGRAATARGMTAAPSPQLPSTAGTCASACPLIPIGCATADSNGYYTVSVSVCAGVSACVCVCVCLSLWSVVEAPARAPPPSCAPARTASRGPTARSAHVPRVASGSRSLPAAAARTLIGRSAAAAACATVTRGHARASQASRARHASAARAPRTRTAQCAATGAAA